MLITAIEKLLGTFLYYSSQLHHTTESPRNFYWAEEEKLTSEEMCFRGFT